MISAIRNITVGVFEHLRITSPMDAKKRLAYMQCILRGAALKKYQEVLVTSRHLANELAGDDWTLGELTRISAVDLWTWAKTDTTRYDGNDYLAWDKLIYFKRK